MRISVTRHRHHRRIGRPAEPCRPTWRRALLTEHGGNAGLRDAVASTHLLRRLPGLVFVHDVGDVLGGQKALGTGWRGRRGVTAVIAWPILRCVFAGQRTSYRGDRCSSTFLLPPLCDESSHGLRQCEPSADVQRAGLGTPACQDHIED